MQSLYNPYKELLGTNEKTGRPAQVLKLKRYQNGITHTNYCLILPGVRLHTGLGLLGDIKQLCCL